VIASLAIVFSVVLVKAVRAKAGLE
jgi:hypothetical protein